EAATASEALDEHELLVGRVCAISVRRAAAMCLPMRARALLRRLVAGPSHHIQTTPRVYHWGWPGLRPERLSSPALKGGDG
ncbi:MAG: hypothetical protein M0008_08790, partial [Actinomycetota bacterium]|nr:hypothetical protein [Actinomycetota bacterium]